MRRLRDHRLVTLTGWTFDQLGNAPAARCDWLLAVEDASATARHNAESRGQTKQPRSR
jgi:hypothetical protein